MTPGFGAYVVAALIFLVALSFALTEWRLLSGLRRRNKTATATERPFWSRGTAASLAFQFLLSLISFPATTFSLKASFFIPWQFLWPAALVFLGSGIVGLLSGAWFLTRPRQRIFALILATIIAVIFSYFALSFLLFVQKQPRQIQRSLSQMSATEPYARPAEDRADTHRRAAEPPLRATRAAG